MSDKTSGIDDLKARRDEITEGAAKRSHRGSIGKTVAMLGGTALVSVGAVTGYLELRGPVQVAPPIPTSEVREFPEDRSAQAALDLPEPPPTILVPAPAPAPVVDSAALTRARELEQELAAARSQAAEAIEEGTERERELRAELDRERDRFAADIAALRSAAENDQDRARETQSRLETSLRELQANLDALRNLTETEKLEAAADAAEAARLREAAFRDEMDTLRRSFQAQLDEAQRVDPLEAERLRLEQERLTIEQARRERLAAEQATFLAEQEKRVTSDLIALTTGGTEEGAGTAERAISSAEAFVRRGVEAVQVSRASLIAAPEATVPQGTILQASLESAIDSSLPGPLRAVVNEDVHSLDGSTVLIPAGSRLFGEYASNIETGQKRILVAWTRILTPANRSISIASFGADPLGRSGTGGAVDTRFFERFGSAAAISIITGGAAALADQAAGNRSSDTTEDLAEGLSRQSTSALNAALSLGPRIYVRQGAAISVILDRDLEIR